MFDRLRKAFAFGSSDEDGNAPASHRAVGRWAAVQELRFDPHGAAGGFALEGDVAGTPWRLEAGFSTREYIPGIEVRARAEVGADPDAAVMVISRALKERLEGDAYGAITDTLQTTVTAELPEEARWLAMFEEVRWPALPVPFMRHFAVVADHLEQAQQWVAPALIEQLLAGVTEPKGDAARAASVPILVMLTRGKVYLRMDYASSSLRDVAHAVGVLVTAAELAPPMPPAAPADIGT